MIFIPAPLRFAKRGGKHLCSKTVVPKKLRDQGSGISSTGKIFMSFGTLT
jgi:hypothetical protein